MSKNTIDDVSDTIAPKSDQLDAVDLLAGPRTFTIESVTRNNAEQPLNIFLREFPRPWRPNKSMLRVLVAAWGPRASAWVGRRVRLFCDPDVTFGKEKVGGTRISHLSHIENRLSVPLIVTRGRSQVYVVEPLVETPEDRIAALRAEWATADPDRRKTIEAEVAELTGTAPDSDPEPDPTLDPNWKAN